MKKLIIAYLFTITNVFGAPPTYFNGELQTNTYIQNIKAPNYQTTPLGGIDRRLETGNLNELQNPNFEHSTVTTGWTVSNATVSGNTSAQFEGKKSLSLALTGALSLSQSSTINAARKSGVQMVASVWVNSSDVSDLQLCSLKNGAEDKCTVTGGYVQGSGWRQLTVSFIGDATSNGLKLKSTDTTGTVLVDSAFVGVGSPIVDFTPDMVYSAKISATGVVSDENTDWIDGNCTNPAAGVYTCTFKTGVFSITPNCVATAEDRNNIAGTNYSSGTVSVGLASRTSGAINGVSTLSCQKQGADYKTSKAYVASSSDFGYTNTGTITITATTTNPTKGTVVTDRIFASRDGQRLIAEYQYQQSSGGSAGSGDYLFTLPYGLSFDSSIVGFYTGTNLNSTDISKAVVGYALPSDGSVISTTSALVAYDATRFRLLAMWGGSNKAFINSTYFSLGSAQGYSMRLNAPIQGWTDSGVIVGSFQGYNETPGTSRVETFSVSYGKTATTVCDGTGLVNTNQCAYLDQIGNAVTSITRSSQGNYTMNTSRTYSKLKCSGTSLNSASGDAWIRGLRCENCASLSFTSVLYNTSGVVDTYGTILCQGIPQ